MEDMIEVLMYVSRFRPQVLEGTPMEELLLFFVTFMGSPAYIKNPYLRSRMVEVRPFAGGLALTPHTRVSHLGQILGSSGGTSCSPCCCNICHITGGINNSHLPSLPCVQQNQLKDLAE